ncbi:MAG: hypothetical protein AB1679_07030 [Actinomycetota bacterium]
MSATALPAPVALGFGPPAPGDAATLDRAVAEFGDEPPAAGEADGTATPAPAASTGTAAPDSTVGTAPVDVPATAGSPSGAETGPSVAAAESPASALIWLCDSLEPQPAAESVINRPQTVASALRRAFGFGV